MLKILGGTMVQFAPVGFLRDDVLLASNYATATVQ